MLKNIHIDVSDLVLEIISIVVAILLALAVNNWVENRKHHELLVDSLQSIRAEVATNLRHLELAHPHHVRVLAAFFHLVDANRGSERVSFSAGWEAFRQAGPGGFNLIVPEETAWTVATSSAATQYMDSRTRTELTKTYIGQHYLNDTQHEFLNTMLHAQPSPGNNFFYSTATAAALLGDLVPFEDQMRDRYTKTLQLLDDELR
ncbi:MAG: hypothetical protein M3N19_08775 [Candidatus Eremiobacteraeota bacterium]|nr:hypothetical protein [Candidatus Eremiobacteraeota bacterium]